MAEEEEETIRRGLFKLRTYMRRIYPLLSPDLTEKLGVPWKQQFYTTDGCLFSLLGHYTSKFKYTTWRVHKYNLHFKTLRGSHLINYQLIGQLILHMCQLYRQQ